MRLTRFVIALCLAAQVHGQSPVPSLLGGRPLVHAHNAYIEDGKWSDRLTRALATGQSPIVIEQDIALGPNGRSVVTHDTDLGGSEPTLEAHFFDAVRPLVQRALDGGDRRNWPAVVLHLDFKTNEREHHRAVWELLVRHRSWLATAAANAQPHAPLAPGPLLVLTENGAGQERDFSEWAVERGEYLLFGSIPSPVLPRSEDPAERARILRTATPETLIPSGATTYRRWVNFSWGAVEEGGPARAGDWTPAERQRLDAIVSRAHQQGLLVRFYTLNGHAPALSRGWSAGYNLGSLEAVRLRWQAARDAQVDLIATDQYEELAALLKARP